MRSLIASIFFITISFWPVQASRTELDWEYEGLLDLGTRVYGLAAISHDGRQLAIQQCDHVADGCDIDIFDLETLQHLGILEIYTSRIKDLAYSPTQTLLASAQNAWHAFIWNPPDTEPLAEIAHEKVVSLSVAFSPDGAYLAIGWRDGLIQIWDVQAEMISREMTLEDEQGITKLLFSPDGRYLVSGGSHLLLWDTHDWSISRTLANSDEALSGIAFTPDSQRLSVSYKDGTLLLIDISNGDALTLLEDETAHSLSLTNPVITRDGRFLIVGSIIAEGGSEIHVYELETLRYRGKVSMEGVLTQLLLSPDDERLYAVTNYEGIHRWRIED
jgi:WD40 repeat protein